MKLIKCPDCGAMVSKKATACPSCGLPDPGSEKPVEPSKKHGLPTRLFYAATLPILVIAGGSYLLADSSNPTKPRPKSNVPIEATQAEKQKTEQELWAELEEIALKAAAEQKKVDDRRSKDVADEEAFAALMEGLGQQALIASISARNGYARITVRNLWHIRNYQIRLQDAQTLDRLWKSISSPREPKKARISIVDYNGNEVGGTGVMGVWVQDR